MKKYSIIIAILAFVAILVSCGHPSKKRKFKHKKHKIEHRMKNDTIHNDSIRAARIKMWKEKKKAKKEKI